MKHLMLIHEINVDKQMCSFQFMANEFMVQHFDYITFFFNTLYYIQMAKSSFLSLFNRLFEDTSNIRLEHLQTNNVSQV